MHSKKKLLIITAVVIGVLGAARAVGVRIGRTREA